jgi:hypothetical protein
MHRRQFLQGSAAAIATLTLSPWLIASTGAPTGGPMRKADFEALLHTWFHVGDPGSDWQSVELESVRDDGTTARTEQFTVVFRGSSSLALEEGTHTLSPETSGDDLELFLQPTEDSAGPALVARFSLLRPEMMIPSCAPRA